MQNLKFSGLAEKETQGDAEVSEAINKRELLFEFLKNGALDLKIQKRNLNCTEYIV